LAQLKSGLFHRPNLQLQPLAPESISSLVAQLIPELAGGEVREPRQTSNLWHSPTDMNRLVGLTNLEFEIRFPDEGVFRRTNGPSH
jgi:hypothetical protein